MKNKCLMTLFAKQRMKLWDSVVWNQRFKKIKNKKPKIKENKNKKVKIIEYFVSLKNIFFFE